MRFDLIHACLLACFVSHLCLSSSARAKDIYIRLDGDDSNPGTRELAIASLGQAKSMAADFAGKEAVNVFVGDGAYYLPETLVFTSKDSGSESCPVTYQAENEGRAILSGGSRLPLAWEKFRDGIYQASVPSGINCCR